jgi:hypothetical protein
MSIDQAKLPKAFDGLKAAAAGMGIPIAILRKCKERGCDGFKGGRVWTEPVLKFIEDNPDILTSGIGEGSDSLNALKIELMRENIKLARERVESAQIDNAKKRGELISRADLEFAIPKCLAHAISVQRKHLTTEVFNTICQETKAGFDRILSEATKNQTEPESEEAA